MHPNSLANLRPAWKKGEQPARPNSGPVIVPALRRFADMTYAQLMAINIDSLTGGEAVALISILKATDPKYGDKMREVVMDRVDGAMPKALDPSINVNVGVSVSLSWGNGEQA